MPGDILETIARLVQSNIRELEGALTRVLAFSDLSGLPLTIQLVQSALADLLPQRNDIELGPGGDRWSPAAFGLTHGTAQGRDRSQDVALPRQVAMYLMREEANTSLPADRRSAGRARPHHGDVCL